MKKAFISKKAVLSEIHECKKRAETFDNAEYRKGYIMALSTLEGFIAGLLSLEYKVSKPKGVEAKEDQGLYSGFGAIYSAREWSKILELPLYVVQRGLSMGHSIERIAEIEDCALYRRMTQAKTEKQRKLYEGFGEKHNCGEWARLLGIPRNSLWKRLKKGHTIEDVARDYGKYYRPYVIKTGTSFSK